VPTIAAVVLAGIVALVVEGALRPYVGVGITAAISLVVWFGVFYVTRRWLLRLRGD